MLDDGDTAERLKGIMDMVAALCSIDCSQVCFRQSPNEHQAEAHQPTVRL